MKLALVAFLAVVAITQAAVVPKLFSDERISQINARAKTWTAGRNFHENTTIDDIKMLLGAKKYPVRLMSVKPEVDIDDESIPESFDAREQWPKCGKIIGQIVDQSSCGSCWAEATTSAISDRICIHSNGEKQVHISAADLLSCCSECGFGCGGGYPITAWQYYVRTGLVSGGEYNSGEGCKPYPFPQCSHHVESPKYPSCPPSYSTPSCSRVCSTEAYTYKEDKHKGVKAYYISRNVKQIQKEILENGPIGAAFDVYDDFTAYKSGVYQSTPGSSYLGGHAVRVLGWGVENGVGYWLVANSWNESWGNNGTFKIIRGSNECNFEGEMTAGLPQTA